VSEKAPLEANLAPLSPPGPLEVQATVKGVAILLIYIQV
jgi:hypothetical protein